MQKSTLDKNKITKNLKKKYELQDEHLNMLVELVFYVSTNSPTRVQNLYKHFIPAVVESETFYDLKERFDKVKIVGRGVSKERLELYYGEIIAEEKWASYKEKQAFTNTFEYKKEKYGWDETKFAEYNLSRAVTLDNQKKKHGEKEGQRKYDIYREKQSYTNTLPYFIEKYGEEGKGVYERINSEKAHTAENYFRLYGDEGIRLLEERFSKTSNFYSDISQKCFLELEKEFPLLSRKSYFPAKNGVEFTKWSKKENRVYMYDYVNTEYNIAIEFHGDHWHANPRMYNPTDTLKVRKHLSETTATEVWERDKKKQRCIEELGFSYIVIWEYDWLNDKSGVIERLENEFKF